MTTRHQSHPPSIPRNVCNPSYRLLIPFWLKAVADHTNSSKIMRLHGRHSQFQLDRNLGKRHLIIHLGHQHASLYIGQLSQRYSDVRSKHLRIAFRRRQPYRCRSVTIWLADGDNRSSVFSPEIDRPIHRHPAEPTPWLRRRLLLTLRPPSQKHILNDVQGVVMTPQNAIGPAIDLSRVLFKSSGG